MREGYLSMVKALNTARSLEIGITGDNSVLGRLARCYKGTRLAVDGYASSARGGFLSKKITQFLRDIA